MYPRSLTQAQLRRLYREVLSNARVFPSKNRVGMVEEIRTEFRQGMSATDPDDIARRIEMALRGLQTMRKYTGLKSKAATWSVDLEHDPLPAPPGAPVKRRRVDDAGNVVVEDVQPAHGADVGHGRALR